MASDRSDPFKDLTFSGTPSEYRSFRRRLLFGIAALEEKHIKLAGPKILNRLTGEAWRATEHLSIQELRSEEGPEGPGQALQVLASGDHPLTKTVTLGSAVDFAAYIKAMGFEAQEISESMQRANSRNITPKV